jgi:hypothetical protein
MSKRTLEPPVIGVAAVYFILFTLVLWPVTDFLSTVLPLQMGRVEWRYASLGIMAVYVTTPILGVAFAMVLAFFLRHRFVLRVLSYLCLGGAVFLLLAVVALGLATAHYRGIATPEGMPSMQIGGLIAGLKHLSAFIAVSLLGLGGLQASRRVPEQSGQKDAAGARAAWLGARTESPGSGTA